MKMGSKESGIKYDGLDNEVEAPDHTASGLGKGEPYWEVSATISRLQPK